jgi:hypothetical protein
MFRNTLFVVSLVLISSPVVAERNSNTQQAVPKISGHQTQIAQNAELCRQLQASYNQCEQSWRSLGGGTSGQAGSFYECMQTYRNAMIAAGC